jgi:para-nitrobenzyl esterase
MPPHGLSGAVFALDGQFVTEDLWEGWRKGHEAPVPLMLGATAMETPPPPPEMRAQFQSAVSKFISPDEQVRLIPAYGSQQVLDDHLSGDFVFGGVMRSLGNLHRAHGHAVYRYRFETLAEAARPKFKGLPHGGEIPYVFGTLDAANWKMEARDRVVADAAMDYWVEFARTGRPSPKGRAAWPSAAGEQIMLFDDAGAKPQVDDRAGRYRALAEIADPRS